MSKDKTVIPNGQYCYEMDAFGDPDLNGGEMPVKHCPYSTYKNVGGVNVPWCSFLDQGGVANGMEDDEVLKLFNHFGSYEKMDEGLPLDMLWDAVKECGENK